MIIKFKKLNAHAKLPQYMTPGSVGMDVTLTDESLTIKPKDIVLASTGLAVEIPPGYEIQVRSRSGLAFKQGVFVLNSPGTIDGDYRGEVKVILTNVKEEPITLKRGVRIAQLVVNKIEQVDTIFVPELEETERSTEGFGSTGQ